ncbi:MAG TPA: GNAT family N-acetyltransferase [Gemmatimonadaceae bacterium]|nr:GNAT family N-acetyltransferase [Gemmatimonadaceae bacterium]
MTRQGEAGRDAGGSASVADASRSLGTSRGLATRPSTVRSTIAVRRATLNDLPIIVELRLALLQENGDHPVYGRLRADARARAYEVFGAQLRSPHEVMFLAEAGGKVTGILRCVETLNSPLLDPDRYCYVSSVFVHPRIRRRGVLKALLQQAESWCVERGLMEMRLHNVPGGAASAAWTAAGFAVVEEVRHKLLRR